MLTVSALLIPTDFSENAAKALDVAKQIARGTNAVLHVMHVVEPVVYPADWSFAQVGFADIEKELEVNTQKQIDGLAEQLASEGFKVITKVVKGRASDEICNYAKNEGISIIAIGTHGRSGLEHFLFGSTTERVLRKAPCPVLSVRIDAA